MYEELIKKITQIIKEIVKVDEIDLYIQDIIDEIKRQEKEKPHKK